MNKLLVTIFTPTYNRCHTLHRLWESLKKQNEFCFEWLIVDDGSVDKTRSAVNYFIENTEEFAIRYYWKNNGGKHRAINYAVEQAEGELFFVVDSDDWLSEDAVANVILYYNGIKEQSGYAGVAGCKCYSDGSISGTTFQGEYIDASSLERERFGITGEKSEVFFTSILKKYPFPEFDGEKFISEAVVWNRIAYDGYKLRWFNKNIIYIEYQGGGLTDNLRENYRANPMGYLTYIGQEIRFQNPPCYRKLLWCGKCIETVEVKMIGKNKICHMLGITEAYYEWSLFFYKLYIKIKNY